MSLGWFSGVLELIMQSDEGLISSWIGGNTGGEGGALYPACRALKTRLLQPGDTSAKDVITEATEWSCRLVAGREAVPEPSTVSVRVMTTKRWCYYVQNQLSLSVVLLNIKFPLTELKVLLIHGFIKKMDWRKTQSSEIWTTIFHHMIYRVVWSMVCVPIFPPCKCTNDKPLK